MKNSKPNLLTTIIGAVLALIFAGCVDEVQVTGKSSEPCGTIDWVMTVTAGGAGSRPIYKSHTGPAGPSVSTISTSVLYRGTFTDGNEFGTCNFDIVGRIHQSNTRFKDWRRYGDITISAPTVAPTTLDIERMSSGGETMAITPACTYKVTITNPDAKLTLTPDKSHTTGSNGEIAFVATDFGNTARSISITVTVTSSCDGTTATGTLTVNVQ